MKNTLTKWVPLELDGAQQEAVCRLAAAAGTDIDSFLLAGAMAGVKLAIRAGEAPLCRAACRAQGKIDWSAGNCNAGAACGR